ncbi:MAG: winged helix-turn-helix transcriptional regulator [Candidatus Bathyarchaeia archaeon]
MLRELEKQVMKELLQNAKTSDRSLSKKLNISQSTITRVRKELERKGYIKNYTIMPDFGKLGCEILAFTFVKMRPESRAKTEDLKNYAANFPNVIYASRGEGMRMTGVAISLHKNYTDYVQKLSLLRQDWGQYLEEIESFVVAIGEGTIKEFSLGYVTECLQ